MRRTTTVVAVILAVIVVAVGGTAFYVLTRLDSLVEAAIEEFGSRATGTKVSLDGVEIDTTNGRGHLVGLRVANPEGFEAGDALSIGKTSISIDLGSLTGDTVVIRDIIVQAPRFRYQIAPDGGNLDRIMQNVRQSGTPAESAPAEGGKGDAAPQEKGRTLVVEHLLIEGTEISVTAAQLGADGVTVSVPTLELRDLGTGEDGLTPEALLSQIMAGLQESAEAEFAKIPTLQAILPAQIGDPVKKALEGTEKTFESLGERIKKLTGD